VVDTTFIRNTIGIPEVVVSEVRVPVGLVALEGSIDISHLVFRPWVLSKTRIPADSLEYRKLVAYFQKTIQS
jgi:hypothetical protein